MIMPIAGWKSMRYIHWLFLRDFPLTAVIIPDGKKDIGGIKGAIEHLRAMKIPALVIIDSSRYSEKELYSIASFAREFGIAVVVETQRPHALRGLDIDAIVLRYPVEDIECNFPCYLRYDIEKVKDAEKLPEIIDVAEDIGATPLIHLYIDIDIPEGDIVTARHGNGKPWYDCIKRIIGVDLSGNLVAPCLIAGKRITMKDGITSKPRGLPCNKCRFRP